MAKSQVIAFLYKWLRNSAFVQVKAEATFKANNFVVVDMVDGGFSDVTNGRSE